MTSLYDRFFDALRKHFVDEEECETGCTEAQLEELRQAQGVSRLPEAYQTTMRHFGNWPENVIGDGRYYPYALDLKQDLLEDLKWAGASFQLPEDAFIVYRHNLHFYFFRVSEGNDPPVYQYHFSGTQVNRWRRFTDFARQYFGSRQE